jgi:hypothetical protein
MVAFRDSVRPGGQPLPLLLADVGYPTHSDLHDVDAAYGERFSRFGAAYSSGDAAQHLFALSLFNALMGRRDFAGLYWWALSDLPDFEPSACSNYVFEEFGSVSFTAFGGDERLLKRLFCTSGLIAPPAAPIRNAAAAFAMWANLFTH